MKKTQILSTPLNFQDDYPCPVCRLGIISHMPLMDAMSCNFCQEIFAVNLELQQIKMPSREPPLVWWWNGSDWTQGRLEGVELGWGYGLAALLFIILPTTLIGITAYFLPSTPHTPLSWIPYIWTILTFILHSAIIVVIFIEVYRIPVFAYLRALARWRNRIIG